MTEVNLFEPNVETSCFNGKKDLTINVFINGDFVSQIKDRKFTVAAKADGGIKVIVERVGGENV